MVLFLCLYFYLFLFFYEGKSQFLDSGHVRWGTQGGTEFLFVSSDFVLLISILIFSDFFFNFSIYFDLLF